VFFFFSNKIIKASTLYANRFQALDRFNREFLGGLAELEEQVRRDEEELNQEMGRMEEELEEIRQLDLSYADFVTEEHRF
jgi:hypothetical protein